MTDTTETTRAAERLETRSMADRLRGWAEFYRVHRATPTPEIEQAADLLDEAAAALREMLTVTDQWGEPVEDEDVVARAVLARLDGETPR
jgi:hypothetical protein